MTVSTQARSIPVARPSIGTEEEFAVLTALRSGWISQGPRVEEFERNFADYVGAPCGVAVSSCTAALHLGLTAVGVKSGDEVLCPSLSFIATANSIVHAGAKPVFVDIDESTYNMDPDRIESAITPRTRAILLVHQIGQPAALREIIAIATRHGLAVVEDAACAVGAVYHAARIGLPHGAVACFSFHPRKIITTGEGGMLTTADDGIACRLRKMRQHSMSVSDLVRHSSNEVVAETYDEVGYNYRMTDLQAALGVAQLSRLDEILAKRHRLAHRYAERLEKFPWLALPMEVAGTRHTFQSYMMRLMIDAPISRNDLMQELLIRGVSTRRGIMAIHREAPYRGDWDRVLPNTNAVSDSTIILPLFHEMTEADQDYVVECIEDAVQ